MKTPFSAAIIVGLLTAQPVWAKCPDKGGVEIYPTANLLPENLLRFYVYYPNSMKADQGSRHVRLLDSEGRDVKRVFLTSRSDLWSPDRRRLTLLMDPGRVKTGLVANAALGRALVAGQSYTLNVSGSALDATDCPLGTDAQYSFSVGVAITTPIELEAWSVSPPTAQSTETLRVDLGRALDHLSLAFRLRVLDERGVVVSGAITLGVGEKTWEFTPRVPWVAAPYTLAIDHRLEDLAGNRLDSQFDRPLSVEPKRSTRRLSFVPKPPAQ